VSVGYFELAHRTVETGESEIAYHRTEQNKQQY